MRPYILNQYPFYETLVVIPVNNDKNILASKEEIYGWPNQFKIVFPNNKLLYYHVPFLVNIG